MTPQGKESVARLFLRAGVFSCLLVSPVAGLKWALADKFARSVVGRPGI